MAKKKKELDPSLFPFLPSAVSVVPITELSIAGHLFHWMIHNGLPKENMQLRPIEEEWVSWSPPENQNMSIGRAYLEYTGFPAMISGGLGAFGFNVVSQAGQVKTGTSMFSAAKYGFGTALLLEAFVGTLIFAGILTLFDPSHHYKGGLDEARFFQGTLPTEKWDGKQDLMSWTQDRRKPKWQGDDYLVVTY